MPSGAVAQQVPADSETLALPEVQVIATPLGAAGGIDPAKIPGTVESLSAADIAGQHFSSAVEVLGQRLPSANLNDVQGNPVTQDLRYRGFAASPLQGTPQGLAVYQNGMRINEAFGDTVNWDLVPPNAIRQIDLFSNNPIFGLNALGGAVNIEMKNGFTYRGFEAKLTGGSFGHAAGALQYGLESGAWGLYLAADGLRDAGWRFQSASEVARLYADLGYRVPGSELHLSLSGGRDRLGVIGPTPIELTARDPRAIYTWPQVTQNQLGAVALNGKFAIAPGWTLQGNVYARRFDQRHVDGNAGEFESCSRQSSFAGQLCLQDDAFGTPLGGKTQSFRDRFLILGPNGATVPFLANTPYGTVDYTRTGATTIGGSAQASNAGRLWERGNSLVLGLSIEHSDFAFGSSSALGFIYPNLFVGANPAVPGTGSRPIRTLGNLGYAPVDLTGTNTYLGLYAADTVDVTDRLSFAFGGRLNIARIETGDASGAAPELSGSHSYARFNPFAGPSFKLTPDISVYAGYSESNRAPTPLELSCADRNRPCLLANALVADPPLKQVVSHSYEAGLRGGADLPESGKLDWKLAAFRTDIDDDILALASAIQGRGFFANVPGTRRQGAEASVQFQAGRWRLSANYALVDASFRFSALLPSPNNPAADANGDILVRAGDRMPLAPRHQAKAGIDFAVTPAWQIGLDVVAFSGQYFAGDEANRNPKLPPYWVANLRSSYRIGDRVELFLDLRNLFDKRYVTYGTYFDTAAVAGATPVALGDPRMVTLAPPLSVYGGVKITW